MKTINAIKLAAIASLAALSACSGGRKVEQAPVQEQKTPLVEAYTSALQIVPQTRIFSSTVQANIVNNISPQTAGRIIKLNVEIGDFVKAGQVLAEIDRVQLDQAALRLKNEET